MATITFSNGAKVNFNGTPTQDDIHAIAHSMGIVDTPPSTTPTPPENTTGSAGQTLIPNSTVGSNLKALPGQLLDAGKSLFGLRGASEDLSAAVNAPATASQQAKLAQQDQQYVSTILGLRNQAKQAGQDTSHWDNLIRNYKPVADPQKTLSELYPALGKSNEQVAGDFAQIAATIAAAGAPEATLSAKPATGIVAGALSGAKTGAIAGATAGGLEGLASGLKSNASAGGVALDVAGGALGGAAAGGLFGALSGGIQGRRLAQAQKEEQFTLNLTKPQTPSAKEGAGAASLYRSPGVFKAASVAPTNYDKSVAKSIEGVVDPKANVEENIYAISSRVQDINSGVKALVRENKVPFNANQLRTKLMDGKKDLNLVFASDTTAENTYNKAVDSFMSYVKGKDTAGLLDARQTWDKIPAVKKLLDSSALGENTKKEVVSAIRQSANDYIASQLPKGNPYRAALQQESRMIEALDRIWVNNRDTVGKNAIQLATQKYPVLKGVIGTLLVGAGLGAVGLGGAAISSSE